MYRIVNFLLNILVIYLVIVYFGFWPILMMPYDYALDY